MQTGTRLACGALLLVVACAASWFYLTNRVALPDNRILFAATFLSAAILGLFAFLKGVNWIGGIAAAFAIFVGCLIPFTIYVSPQKTAVSAIEVGDTIPHFTSLDERGEVFDSDQLNGHFVLIKFFRAHW